MSELEMIKLLREALKWMDEAIEGCEDGDCSTALPRGYPYTPKKIRAFLKRIERQT